MPSGLTPALPDRHAIVWCEFGFNYSYAFNVYGTALACTRRINGQNQTRVSVWSRDLFFNCDSGWVNGTVAVCDNTHSGFPDAGYIGGVPLTVTARQTPSGISLSGMDGHCSSVGFWR